MTHADRIARLERVALALAANAGLLRAGLGPMDPSYRQERAEVLELVWQMAAEREEAA